MPLALVLSSYVAAARIGGAAQQYVLAAHGVDPILIPTVLFARSPARGDPMGAAVDDGLFRKLCEGVRMEKLAPMVDLVLTGHFSTPDQVAAAAELIGEVRAAAQGATVVVDPILGDEPRGLYIREPVEAALRERLLPLADWLTPNLWELQRLTGETVTNLEETRRAAAKLGRDALVTSVPVGPGEIGVLCRTERESRLYTHRKLSHAPNGTGDVLAAGFGAAMVSGAWPFSAAETAVKAVAMAVDAAAARNAPELPLVTLGARLAWPDAEVRVEVLA